MPNKTISVPDDVLPIIDRLDVPFSKWVATQLRLHAATQGVESFSEQLVRDAELAAGDRPQSNDMKVVGERMERSAPW